MQKIIKFRGRNKFTGELVYGDLIHQDGQNIIFDGEKNFVVEAESVAQFVGYDEMGAEVYEGDKIISDDGAVVYAAISRFCKTQPSSDLDFTQWAKSYHWKLKGANYDS